VTNLPSFPHSRHDDNCMHLCDKRHELVSDTGIDKDGSDLGLQWQIILNFVLLAGYGGEVDAAILNKNPFVVPHAEPIY